MGFEGFGSELFQNLKLNLHWHKFIKNCLQRDDMFEFKLLRVLWQVGGNKMQKLDSYMPRPAMAL